MWFGRFLNSWKWGICFVIFAINQLQTFQDYLRGPYRQNGPHHGFQCKKATNWTNLAISKYCGSSKVFQLVLSDHPLFRFFEPKWGFVPTLHHMSSIFGIKTTQKWYSVTFQAGAFWCVSIFVKIYPKIDFWGVKNHEIST